VLRLWLFLVQSDHEIFTKGSSAFLYNSFGFFLLPLQAADFCSLSFYFQRLDGLSYRLSMAPSFAKAGVSDFFRNLLVLGWRFVDQV
jgi:hypothetical protein